MYDLNWDISLGGEARFKKCENETEKVSWREKACYPVSEELKQKCLYVMNLPSAKAEDQIPAGLIKPVEPASVSLSLSQLSLSLSLSLVNEYNVAAEHQFWDLNLSLSQWE